MGRSTLFGALMMAFLFGPGCGASDLDSDSAAVAKAVILTAGTDTPLVTALDVVGTAEPNGGPAIIVVAVGGFPAKSTAGNFATWEVTIPFDDLVAMRDDANRVHLPILVQDLWGQTYRGRCAEDQVEDDTDTDVDDDTDSGVDDPLGCLTVVVDPSAKPQGSGDEDTDTDGG